MALATNEELAAVFPPCESFQLKPYKGHPRIRGLFTDTEVTRDGTPEIRAHPDITERATGHWRLIRAKLAPGKTPGLPRTWRHYAQGELAVLITDRALRCAYIAGGAEGVGRFKGGRGELNPTLVLAFTWPLDTIDCVTNAVTRGRVREVSIGNVATGAWLHTVEANAAKESFIVKGIGLRNRLREFSDAVVAQVADDQRHHPERRERAEAVLRGERTRGRDKLTKDDQVTAWFIEQPTPAQPH